MTRIRVKCFVIDKPFCMGRYQYAYGETKEQAFERLKDSVKGLHHANLNGAMYKEIK